MVEGIAQQPTEHRGRPTGLSHAVAPGQWTGAQRTSAIGRKIARSLCGRSHRRHRFVPWSADWDRCLWLREKRIRRGESIHGKKLLRLITA
jgi:hypothetical protein